MIELRAGAARVTIDEARGARISSMTIGGREIVLGPPDDSNIGIRWGSFLMAPWAGRIEGGVLDWDGRRYQLPQRDGANAIHGLVYERAWAVDSTSGTTAELNTSLTEAGWPFGGVVRQWLELRPDTLVTTAEIRFERDGPVGIGWHPWFLRGGYDPCVTVNGAETLETVDLIPTGRRLPVDAVTDLRAGPRLGDRQLDTFYPDAASPAMIRWEDFELAVEFDAPLQTVIVFSGDPRSVCVEPQSGWPNAPALAARGVEGTGIATIGRGEAFRASMTWRWRPVSATPGSRPGRSIEAQASDRSPVAS
jgi:aldose 1-epimerase